MLSQSLTLSYWAQANPAAFHNFCDPENYFKRTKFFLILNGLEKRWYFSFTSNFPFFQSMIEVQSSQPQGCTFEDEIGWIYIFAAVLGGSSSSLLSASSAICQIKAPTHPLVKVLIGILFLLSSFPHTQRGIPSRKPPDNESAFTFHF